ncbi:hypothetical protein [uncultured Psychroserpens sp.]|uniref:hypothetical protein n=1 Tax=uncultured Psychroserpens sp. TaxID=255436 RepID=UPI00262B8EE8|nr:hypothetical protein [uncultured Psychroserpens sp.]
MKFSLNKLLRKSEKAVTSSQDSVDEIIKNIEHIPFGISEANVLYAGLNELGGYYFFQTVIVGSFQMKVKNGAQLIVFSHDFELQLQSDMLELESDHTDITGRYITKIDFQIEEVDAAKIKRSSIKEIHLKSKKQGVTFSMYELSEEEA